MGVKILIYILFSFSLMASNIDGNMSNINIKTSKPQKIISSTIKQKITNANNKIDKVSVQNIAKDEYLKNFSQTQLSYQNAIMDTNNNLTYLGYMVTIIFFLFGILTYIKYNEIKKSLKAEMQEEISNTLEQEVSNRIFRLEGKLEKTLESQSSKKIKKITKSEIELAMSELFNLQKLSGDLHFYLNQTLVHDINKESPSKAFAKYNQSFEKIINITSLQKEHIIPALKEIKVPMFRSILHSNEMKKYLEALKDYTDDSDIIVEVNKLLSIIRIHNQNNSKNRNDKSKTNNIKRKLNNEDKVKKQIKTKSISILNRIKNLFNK